MTSNQERARPTRGGEHDRDQPADGAAAEVSERKGQLDAEVDELLDEIDDVLEENAEEFVTSFVQKGGE